MIRTELKCEKCNDDLISDVSMDCDIVRISVRPCEICMTEALEEQVEKAIKKAINK